MTNAEHLIYLYGIVPADGPDPTAELLGIEDAPVYVQQIGRVGAVLSYVPADVYEENALNSRLDDLSWVGDRGIAHERVVDWFSQKGAIIPLSLFSLHSDLGRLETRVRGDESEFAEILERLRGKREWGVKLWRRDAEVGEGIDHLSISLTKLNEEIAAAPPGKRFLLERKREGMRAEEVRSLSKRIAHELHDRLRRASAAGTSVAIASVPGAERALLLNSAYLVPDERFSTFHETLSTQARELKGTGFELELTGPWPPYHFTNARDE